MDAFALIVLIVAILDSLPVRISACDILVCQTANPCQNEGECTLNMDDCTPRCNCPPPYNDTQLYDEKCQARRGGEVTNTSVTTDPCSSANVTCMLASPCLNGGTCVVSSADCAVTCRCPSPYDDPALNDQHCRPKNKEEPGQENEIVCPTDGIFQCGNGRCIGKKGANGPSFFCICDTGWAGKFCQYPCNRTCQNGGRCHYLEDTKEAKCNCPYPWTGVSCQVRPSEATGLASRLLDDHAQLPQIFISLISVGLAQLHYYY